MSSYVIPPPVICQPVRRNPEKARKAWRRWGPIALGAVTFPFFWVSTVSIPPDPVHAIDNLQEITRAVDGDTGWIQSLKVARDIDRDANAYATVIIAGATADAEGRQVLMFLEQTSNFPESLMLELQHWKTDPDWRVRRAVARATRKYEGFDWSYAEGPFWGLDRDTVAAQWLSDPNEEVRQEGVDLVGSMTDHIPEEVRKLATSRDPEIKLAAVRALARSGAKQPEDDALLRRVLRNPDKRIQAAANYGLSNSPGS